MSVICNFGRQVKLRLLYRASEDGFSSSAFHSRCDNISSTVTLVKTMAGYIFGGYTKRTWNDQIDDSDELDVDGEVKQAQLRISRQLCGHTSSVKRLRDDSRYLPYSNKTGTKHFVVDPNAFIFSLANKLNTPFCVTVRENEREAIGRSPFHGPMFGRQNFFICDNSSSVKESFFNLGGCYAMPDGLSTNDCLAESNRFLLRDIEIFQVSYL